MLRARLSAVLLALLAALSLFGFAGCAGRGKDIPPGGGTAADGETPAGGEETEKSSMDILLTIGGQTFRAVLENSETGEAFAALLPLTLEMRELNGNEKYFYLEEPLPARAERVGNIEAGDLMLYGTSCVVLFYESFPTSYSYTRIGRVENAAQLAAAVGGGSVTVAFSANG